MGRHPARISWVPPSSGTMLCTVNQKGRLGAYYHDSRGRKTTKSPHHAVGVRTHAATIEDALSVWNGFWMKGLAWPKIVGNAPFIWTILAVVPRPYIWGFSPGVAVLFSPKSVSGRRSWAPKRRKPQRKSGAPLAEHAVFFFRWPCNNDEESTFYESSDPTGTFVCYMFFTCLYFPAPGQAVVTGAVLSCPRFLLNFLFRRGFSNPNKCSSSFRRALPTHALALSASRFVH